MLFDFSDMSIDEILALEDLDDEDRDYFDEDDDDEEPEDFESFDFSLLFSGDDDTVEEELSTDSEEEMDIVIGPLEDNSFLRQLRVDTEEFTTKIREIFVGLTK